MSQPTPHFLFPRTESTVLPDPSVFFSPHLLSTPLPTNSFFQNLVLNDGDEPEYIHPYLINSCMSSLSICYPTPVVESTVINYKFCPDLTISALNNRTPNSKHVVSSFDDLSVTLDFPSCNLRFFLVRGSPFLTFTVTSSVALSISTEHIIRELSWNRSRTKYTINLDNNQTWLLYCSSLIDLQQGPLRIISGEFSGTIRIALLTDSNPLCEEILDRFSYCYPVSGYADITKSFHVEYRWEKKGQGDLLMLAHPLHVRLLSPNDCSITLLEDFKYKSIDGELVGIVGNSWMLKSNTLPVSWFSVDGIEEELYPEIREVLYKDVEVMCCKYIYTPWVLYYRKLIASVARLALIAQEVCYFSVIPTITRFLMDKIEPWLDGTCYNGFLYNGIWGGTVLKNEEFDFERNVRYGLYHDHHFQTGYLLYIVAVLARIDPAWGRKYRPQAFSLVADFMNLDGKGVDSSYPRLRCFDLWKLHSWDGGLNTNECGRHWNSSTEALNAYYSAVLIGLAYEDAKLVDIGSTLLAMEIQAANTWWHVRERDNMYPEIFTREARSVIFSSSTMRKGGTDWELFQQVLPLLPITEFLFSDVGYVRELVEWLMNEIMVERIMGSYDFVCALQGIYDKGLALDMTTNIKWFYEGSSLTNLLWWIHSRGDVPSPFGSSPTSSSVIEWNAVAQKPSMITIGGKVSSNDYGVGEIEASRRISTSIGCKEFTYEELCEATKGFSDFLGSGAFASVYKGILTDGKEVAVKFLIRSSGEGDRDFWTEVEIISQMKHRCLVKLLGYCRYKHQRMLVYDYIPNKTLHYHLHGEGRPVMAWAHRVKVAFDVVRGIEYLHEGCGDRIIHRDIKSTNILLDNDFNAKVADFGLAKFAPKGKTVEASRVAGTYGYFAPEYAMYNTLTEKSDVYSFGVVLLELITGREPLALKISLVDWAEPFLKKPINNDHFQTLVDGRLQKNFDKREMTRMIEIATDCVRYKPAERPEMGGECFETHIGQLTRCNLTK